jgi:cell division protein FtsB
MLQEYNQRMDELMERARVEDIQRREAEEARKLEQRVKDREVIVSQIKAREQRKIIEEEAREQEGLVSSDGRAMPDTCIDAGHSSASLSSR